MRMPPGPVTNWLVVANVIVWVLLWLTDYSSFAAYYFGFTPALMTDAIVRVDMVQLAWAGLLLPLTGAFLHAGLGHLALNMMLLLFTGRFVEFAIGSRQFALLYFVALYAAAYAEFAINGDSVTPIVGASGAGSGIIAAYMLLYARNRPQDWGPIPAFWARRISLFALWVLLNVAIGRYFFPGGAGVAVVAHIGGFAAGLLLTRPLLDIRYRQQ